MNNEVSKWDAIDIRNRIHAVRGMQVMLDSDLAQIYGVETKMFNRAVKRNIERFPDSFRFQLTKEEYENLSFESGTSSTGTPLRCQNGTLKTEVGRGQHRKYLPYAFTEQGIAMLSAVLRSKMAIEVSIKVIDAFVEMRRFIQNNAQVFARLDSVERRQIKFESETEKNFERVFTALNHSSDIPKQGIFYGGQIFDAYSFASNLIRKAKSSIVLIDNYVDDTVLTLFEKRRKGVIIRIMTKSISKQLKLDLQKHNEQYPSILVEIFKDAHDRFLIIDEKDIYHIGASLKDLGKKWFAFSKFETGAIDMLNRLPKSRRGRNYE